jgi:hypothetical protein
MIAMSDRLQRFMQPLHNSLKLHNGFGSVHHQVESAASSQALPRQEIDYHAHHPLRLPGLLPIQVHPIRASASG